MRQHPAPWTTKPVAAMKSVTSSYPVERLWELYSLDPFRGRLHNLRTGKPLMGWNAGRGFNTSVPLAPGKKVQANYGRFVYAWCTGTWPPDVVDHIDRNPTNNKPWNLRAVSVRENSHNSSTFTGASYNKRTGKWRSFIRDNGKQVFLGYYNTQKEAQHAYWSEHTRRFGQSATLAP